jgi:hypothetical protein
MRVQMHLGDQGRIRRPGLANLEVMYVARGCES